MRYIVTMPAILMETFGEFLVLKSYDGDTLLLNNIQRSDMGAYLCIASNGIPPSVSKRFIVKVHCKYPTASPILSPTAPERSALAACARLHLSNCSRDSGFCLKKALRLFSYSINCVAFSFIGFTRCVPSSLKPFGEETLLRTKLILALIDFITSPEFPR